MKMKKHGAKRVLAFGLLVSLLSTTGFSSATFAEELKTDPTKYTGPTTSVTFNTSTNEFKAIFHTDDDKWSAIYQQKLSEDETGTQTLVNGEEVSDPVLLVPSDTPVHVDIVAGDHDRLRDLSVTYEDETLAADTTLDTKEYDVKTDLRNAFFTLSAEKPVNISFQTDMKDTLTSFLFESTDAAKKLKMSDFTTKQLTVKANDASLIVNKDDVIKQQDSSYQMEFTSEKQTRNAYAYYKNAGLSVDIVKAKPEKVMNKKEVNTTDWNQSSCDKISLNYDPNCGTVVLEDLDVNGWLLLTVDSKDGYFIEDVVLSDDDMVYYPYEVDPFGTYSQFAFRIPKNDISVDVSYVTDAKDIPDVSFPNSYHPDKKTLVNLAKDTHELRKSDRLYEKLDTGDSSANQDIDLLDGEIENGFSFYSWGSQSADYTSGARINYEGHTTNWMWGDGRIAFCARPKAATPPNGTYRFNASWEQPTDIYNRLMAALYGGELFESSSVKSLFQQFGWNSAEQQYAYSHVIMTLAGNNAAAVQSDNFDRNSFSPSCFTGLSNASVNNVLHVTHHIVRNVKTAPAGFKTVMFLRDTGYQAVFGSYAAPPKGGLSVQKTSGNPTLTNNNPRYDISGAQYGIFNDQNCQSEVKTITTNNTGYAATGDTELDGGKTYYVKEKKAPKGYQLDPKVYPITVQAGTSASVNRVSSVDQPKTGRIDLIKTSTLPTITNNNGCYTLKGGEYTFATDAQFAHVVGKIVTDEQGKGSLGNLAFGTYYVKETVAPKGYLLDKKVHSVTLTETNESVSVQTLKVSDIPGNDPAGIEISKLWDGDKTATIPPLDGTQFTIWYYDGYFTKDNLPDYDSYQSQAKRKWTIEIKYNKNTGKYIAGLTETYLVNGSSPLFKDPSDMTILPLGTIAVQETKAAPGYTLDGEFTDKHGNTFKPNEKYVTQIKDSNSGIVIQGGNKYSAEDTPVFGSIKIKKLDSDGKTPLSNAKFELKNEKGTVLTVKTTDTKGEILFDNLYPDVYTITELETPDGHTLLKDPLVVEVPTRVTESDMQKYDIDKSQCVYNQKEGMWYIHNFTYEITNHATFDIPMTGGFTTGWVFLPLLCGFLALGAFSILVFRRRRH